MSLSISPYTQPQQTSQPPMCFMPPTTRPALWANAGQVFAQPFPGNGSQLLNPTFPNSFMGSLQSVFGMVQQVMASVERVVSMVSNLVSGLFGGAQASAAGQLPGALPSDVTGATQTPGSVTTAAPTEQKPSKWESILNIGSTIMSLVGMFTGGGAGSILGSLGGLFKGGAGKIVDLVKKGISLFS